MGAREKWFFKEGDKIYQHSENDGWAYVRRGPEAADEYMGTVEELKDSTYWPLIVKDLPELGK